MTAKLKIHLMYYGCCGADLKLRCNTHWPAEPNNKIASDHLGEKQEIEIHARSRAACSPFSGAAATL